MSDAAIQVESLGKRYRIGRAQRTNTLRDAITQTIAAPFRRMRHPLTSNGDDTFWALNNVTFEVKRGEVIGVIGRNGAGKSTLLKILSRITEPTEGEARIYGRVGSLLEVGTGFHPELTGRENVFLNGAILGMKRSEIARKFDEIVSFSEIEKFIDTPVKHYSSGMYMRLAFAVAAHLEPEILVVDEVLAVGDAEFQNKCLGKMREVGRQSRTVLFVSHNMAAVQTLCDRVLMLKDGTLVEDGHPEHVVGRYLATAAGRDGEVVWSADEAPGASGFKLLAVRTRTANGRAGGTYSTRLDLTIEMDFETATVSDGLCIGFDVVNAQGMTVFRTYQNDQARERWPLIQPGRNRLRCVVPAGLLNGGVYLISPRVGIHHVEWMVQLDNVLQFEMVLDHGVSPLWNSQSDQNRPGATAPVLRWTSA
jgi:lipopolysaccharide transport system ATP-binding protein